MPREIITLDGQMSRFNLNRNVKTTIDGDIFKRSQAYSLSFDEGYPKIIASDAAGVFYAKKTLEQLRLLIEESGALPLLTITDWPDFEARGVMLDISRDKVPTMETLFQLIDQLASWKINEFQLYTEHTFAYKNHQKVWETASPITAEEILILDKYCKERFIDLVPNQNSFGHMNRWLKLDDYKHLAECEYPVKSDWGMRSRNILSPAVPQSLELIDELYAELLPNFTSDKFNIGCDETIELGLGKSKSLTNKYGKGQVYLHYLKELESRAAFHGKRVQFWGDIILHHPSLIDELPNDMIAMVWGYEANHPFASQCLKFEKSGIDFYVCPGTSSWGSIVGRQSNMKGNLLNAAVNGEKFGATGYLNTNWGDRGNWQPLTFCQPGYLYGAALSWCSTSNEMIPIDAYLSRYVFKDKSGVSGKAICEIADLYRLTGVEIGNDTVFNKLLQNPKQSLYDDPYLRRLRNHKMSDVLKVLDSSLAQFNDADITAADGDIIIAEVNNAVALVQHSLKLALAKKGSSSKNIDTIDQDQLIELKRDIDLIIAEHNRLWLIRNRLGGLKESSNRLSIISESYKKYIADSE